MEASSACGWACEGAQMEFAQEVEHGGWLRRPGGGVKKGGAGVLAELWPALGCAKELCRAAGELSWRPACAAKLVRRPAV
ncbi:hypothetical protein Taro_050959 [Colocasia esculenta]|uniref:Uncharacterized protein n=1 Tax=Colocasia esculenta TaxID=4460 RepID=A0A843XF73_COLES|nr:hypothetical protein [Colocasia esculenta]